MKYLERFKVCCTTWYQDPGDRYTWSCWHFEKNFQLFLKCLNNILVIKKEKKLKKCFFFWFMALKSYEAFFWPFYARALWPQKWSFWQKNYFTKFVFTLFKKSQNFRSLALTQLKWGLKNSRGGSYMTPPRHE